MKLHETPIEKLIKQKNYLNIQPSRRLLRFRNMKGDPEMSIMKGKNSCEILTSSVKRKPHQLHPALVKAMIS